MKLDSDTLRSVLLEVEALTRAQVNTFEYRAPHTSYDPQAIRAVHAFELEEHGYLGGIRTWHTMGEALVSPELTMAGANLLDSIREQTVWEKVKDHAKERGLSIPLDSIPDLVRWVAGLST